MIGRRACLVAAGSALLPTHWAFLTAARAQTGPRKLKPSPGRDPGGVAVAVIGAGLDYRRPEIAARLARDGEGELIGWDIIDDDPLPLEAAPAPGRRVPPHAGSAIVAILLREAGATRLIPVRSIDANVLALGGAMAFVARTPARVVAVLAGGTPGEGGPLFADEARKARHQLIIVPALHAAPLAQATTAATRPGNIIVVTATDGAGTPLLDPAQEGGRADIAVPLLPEQIPTADTPDRAAAIANAAAARLAALAARLVAVEPDADGARLKAQIMQLGEPAPGPIGSTLWLPRLTRRD